MFNFSVLASGSTGNSIYIATKDVQLLIDVGLSGRKIENNLSEIGVNISDIDGILVTHEHDDHVRGLGVLSRKYNTSIYANQKTIAHLSKNIGNIENSEINYLTTDVKFNIGSLEIEPFGISHDAAEPVGYIFKENNFKISVVTDLGYVSKSIKEKIKGSDLFIFEANHDVGLLRMSSYPWHIKQRILSDIGHLSNEMSGEVLSEVITDNTQKVYLAHLSKENNLQELAHLTVKNILEQNSIFEKDVTVMDTYPNKPTKLDKLDYKKEIPFLKTI